MPTRRYGTFPSALMAACSKLFRHLERGMLVAREVALARALAKVTKERGAELQ